MKNNADVELTTLSLTHTPKHTPKHTHQNTPTILAKHSCNREIHFLMLKIFKSLGFTKFTQMEIFNKFIFVLHFLLFDNGSSNLNQLYNFNCLYYLCFDIH